MKRAIFLDRDGTINYDHGYVYEKEKFEFIERSIEALKIFQQKGFSLFIVTNQAGISRGLFTEKQYLEVEKYVHQQLENQGVNIVKTAYCPYYKYGKIIRYNQSQVCRKPSPVMIKRLAQKYNIYLRASYMVGDRFSDIEAGWRAGVISVGLHSGSDEIQCNKGRQVETFPSLIDFANFVS